VDGLIKDRLNYQGVDPAELGREHQIVLGKHSGSHAVIQAYADMSIHLTRPQAESLLLLVRRHTALHKRPPADEELRQFYFDVNQASQARRPQ
jgi:homocitrate synthase NifV